MTTTRMTPDPCLRIPFTNCVQIRHWNHAWSIPFWHEEMGHTRLHEKHRRLFRWNAWYNTARQVESHPIFSSHNSFQYNILGYSINNGTPFLTMDSFHRLPTPSPRGGLILHLGPTATVLTLNADTHSMIEGSRTGQPAFESQPHSYLCQ